MIGHSSHMRSFNQSKSIFSEYIIYSTLKFVYGIGSNPNTDSNFAFFKRPLKA